MNGTVRIIAVAVGLVWAATGQAEPSVKPALELQVFLGDKLVGDEVLRRTPGKDVSYWSTQANLQDKVAKVWRAFKQRTHLQLDGRGEIVEYDRWIDVTGATTQDKLFQFQGKWKTSHQDPVNEEGKKPKPVVKEIPLAPPFVVLDERVPSLVVLAAERMAGQASCHYVRIDTGASGQLTVTTEALVSKAGARFERVRLRGDKLELEVLRDHAGKVVSVKGVDGWRAVAKEQQVPRDLTVVALADAPTPAAK